jgi:PhoH-like ATPase
LHELRTTHDKIFLDVSFENFNKKKIEFLPVNFLRGATISDAFVIVDEITNFSRTEVRSILSRMGENVKVVCTGDPNQIDNYHLSKFNNGLN